MRHPLHPTCTNNIFEKKNLEFDSIQGTSRFSSLVEDCAIGTEKRVLPEVAPGAHGNADVKDLFRSVELGVDFKRYFPKLME